MSDKNIEMMKKLIEAKKNKGAQKDSLNRPQKTIGQPTKGRSSKKNGGVFDK
jgi:hypothetical protein